MNCDEQALLLPLAQGCMVGVLARPQAPLPLGVLIVVGGPQYRAGSHRQFVLLARSLAAAGYAVLRWDVRGMGDSPGDAPSFEQLDDDIAAAIDGLQGAVPQVRQVVLWGLCDGASAALLYVQRRADVRVLGLCLLNPWVRSAASASRTLVTHYYATRLRQREFWAKLLRGKVTLAAARELRQHLGAWRRGRSRPEASFQQRMASAWQQFRGPRLLLLSGLDYTAKEFDDEIRNDPAWRGALQHPALTLHRLAQADHTFSQPSHADSVATLTAQWLGTISALAKELP